MVKMIYASDINGVIGINNTLPWHLPSDLKRFKELTLDQFVVMGRNTYESLPERFRPLPGRSNVVFSTTNIIDHEDVLSLHDVNAFLEVAKRTISPYTQKEIWIIGGARLFNSCIDYVDEIHHTKIFKSFEGDSYFKIENHLDKFKLDSTKHISLAEDKGLEYNYDIYKRK